LRRRPVVPRRPAGDDGAGTVLVLAVVLAALLLATAVAVLGTAVVARHRAAGVADLAALAAADVLLGRTAGDPCAAAASVAAAGGAALARCTPAGQEVVVEVRVDVRGVLAGLGPARGSARAGPAPVTAP
jgi:secretion/DNA translocation related TadE-like protein